MLAALMREKPGNKPEKLSSRAAEQQSPLLRQKWETREGGKQGSAGSDSGRILSSRPALCLLLGQCLSTCFEPRQVLYTGKILRPHH